MIAHQDSRTAHSLASVHPSSAGRALTVSALGVVFGDIGTSPLYAFKQCFTSAYGVALTEQNVIGVLSLIVWSLVVVVSIKYVAVMLRADNRGEGGVLALSTLVSNSTCNWKLWAPISAVGVLGASLFFGDGMLTPAISVLSAVEGLKVAAPDLEALVVPITVAILIALFAVQKSGTDKVGRIFGPIIIAWFVALAALGAAQIWQAPQVLKALNPLHAAEFFVANGIHGFLVLSAVFLCVTGGEALYADMGHFGRVPIRNAWFRLVLPALTLNYFGQGALVLQQPEAIRNSFYLLAPDWLLPGLIALATAATIIASQAVISGVFSVTTQAMNLGYLPRLRVMQPSAASIGQVYVPTANWIVFAGTVLLVVGFRSSEALAGAYGIAVSATMLLGGLLVLLVPPRTERIPRWMMLALLGAISAIDLAFFSSNLLRALDSGWIPIAIAIAVFLIMSTWSDGRRELNWTVSRQQTPIEDFRRSMQERPPERATGTAVYLTNEASTIPMPLVQQLKFHRFLHESVIILTFARAEVPRVANEERIEIEPIADGVVRVIARYGFMERPNAENALQLATRFGIKYDPNTTLYVVGRTTPVVTLRRGLPMWRKRLYAMMARNSRLGYEFFGVPTERLLEIGTRVEI